MMVPIILLVLAVIVSVIFIIVVAGETKRTHPELGDLPAAILTIFLIAFISYAIEKLRQLDAKINSSIQPAEGLGGDADKTRK